MSKENKGVGNSRQRLYLADMGKSKKFLLSIDET